MLGLPTRGPSSASSPRCSASSGSSTARRRSRGPSRCCAISPAIPIASPSRTAASLQPTSPPLTVRTAHREPTQPSQTPPIPPPERRLLSLLLPPPSAATPPPPPHPPDQPRERSCTHPTPRPNPPSHPQKTPSPTPNSHHI